MYEPRDEISLRELYLIFRSGFLAIVLAALVAGAAAYLYLGSQPDRFEATATVQINAPSPDSASEEAAWLLPPAGMGMNSYAAIAHRSDVVAEAFDLPPDDVAHLREEARRLDLTAVDTAAQARGQLTVAHTASAATAGEASRIANEWANASVAAATEAMTRTVTSNAEASGRELSQREADLQAARQQWTEFSQRDERDSLVALLAAQQQLRHNALLRSAELDNLIVTTRAKRDLLQAVLAARTGGSTEPLDAQLRAMTASGALDPEAAAQFESALSQVPGGATATGQDLMQLVSRTQLETLTADLAGYTAERELHQRTMGEADSELTEIRTSLAALNQEAEQVQLKLVAAQRAYESVAALAPLVRLQQGMIGNAAKVIVQAEPPLEPDPRNRLTITLAAALVAGLLATLFVFLRAAIREPEPPLAYAGVNSRQVDIDRTSGSPKRTGEWPAGGFVDPEAERGGERGAARPEERLAEER